jgi:hypothetical protein
MKREIPEDDFLFKQVIIENQKKIKIFIGLGLMNSKGEISKDFPVDILIIIGALLKLKKTFDLDMAFIIGDQNAILQINTEDSDKINELAKETEKTIEKLKKILKHFEIFDFSKIIKASSMSEEEDYHKIKLPEINISPYAKEQLRAMKYYKLKGYKYRLSWKGDLKRKHTKNDEECYDNLYKEAFNEDPMKSIYIKSGKKSLPHGTGTAIPYSFYESENKSRIPFREIEKFDFQNDKIKNHTINLLKFFIKDTEINENSYNKFVNECLS